MAKKTSVATSMTDREAFEAYLEMASLVKGGRVAANWLPDGRFWFVEGAPENTSIQVFDPATSKISPMFDVGKVRAALREAVGREPPYEGLPFAAFQFVSADMVAFAFEGADYQLDTKTHTIMVGAKANMMDTMLGVSPKTRLVPQTFVRPYYFGHDGYPAPEMLSADRQWFAGLKDHNVSLRSTVDNRREALTSGGTRNDSWDVDSVTMGVGFGGTIVHRTISPWSADSLKLFATRFDQREVGDFHTIHFLKHFDEHQALKMARTGDALPMVQPYVIDVLNRTTTAIDVPTEDRFLIFLGWREDGREIYFVQFSRDVHEAWLYAADASTGAARLIHSERGETFIRIQHDVLARRPGCTLLAGGEGFLWESERDGWKHLYRYDMDGRLKNAVTSGEWPAIDVIGVDVAGGWVYFTAHHDQARPYDVHLCRAPLAGGKTQRLTEAKGVHEIQLAPDFATFIATVSRPDAPPCSEVRAADGKLLHRFEPMDLSGLEAVGWTAPEEVSAKAADGETDLWGVIYKPRDFDPAKSYPVVEYIYGGPQVSMAPHTFLTPSGYKMSGLNLALPQLGYVVVVMDGRGTPERSKAFQDVTYKEWRRHMTDDHAAALKNLAAERPWMDLDRVGMWGHSWGGYSTFACMIDHPEVYRAGLCSAPGFDPYDLFIYEPYLGGVPGPDNKAAYDDALLYTDAPKLQGRLMMVAGSSDIAVWHNAVKMSNTLIEAGKDHELVMLPGQQHGYTSLHETYFVEKLISHFDRHVKNAHGGDA